MASVSDSWGSSAALPESESRQFFRRKESLAVRTENPFENEVPWTKYEVFKAIVLGPTLFPIRFVIFIIVLVFQILLCKVATVGFPFINDRGCLYHKQPAQLWRRVLLLPVFLTNRLLLLCLGFWRIRIVDRRKDKLLNPNIIVVGPHQAITDAFLVTYAFPPLPGAVGKKDLLDIPLMSANYIAGQGIFVDRKNANSRHACKDAIAFRADPLQWSGSPTMIFPEGTTTNAKLLVQFKVGAFCPGQPVQPVLLRYPNKHYCLAWVGKNENLVTMIVRMMLQFTNYCEIEIMEPYVPSAAEQADPKLFAQNVRMTMAKVLGIGTTEHTYEDVFLSGQALKLGIGSDFEVQDLAAKYGVTYDQLEAWLKGFAKLDLDGDGELSYSDFERVIQGKSTLSTEAVSRLFAFFDTDMTGTIQYREFVQVVALLSGTCSMESKAQLAFLIYDSEGRGCVRRDRLRTSLDLSMGVAGGGLACGPSPAGDILGAGERGLPRDGEDELTFEEFSALVHAKPQVLERAFDDVRTRLGLCEP